jgi:tRNA dimethylallyltransferase
VAARLAALVGPTASGKSALALELAEALPAEIVSCDSLQVYRGLDIGSAKPTAAERARVRHHLIDVVEPEEAFSAADYARLARAALEDVRARGRRALVVGGTGLYLRALLSGLFAGPARDEALRARLTGMAERWGDARLHRLLRRVDPAAAARLPPRDRVRVVRALEVYRATGRPLSGHHGGSEEPLRGFEVRVFGLDPGREGLRAAVEARAARMLEGGLLAEVEGLLRRVPEDARPLRAIGYRQAVEVVRGRRAVADALRDIVTDTMRYAKRQRTWFRHQATVHWFASPADAGPAVADWLRG